MSTHLPIPVSKKSSDIFYKAVSGNKYEIKEAYLLNGLDIGMEVFFSVAERNAHIPTFVHGEIRRIHHHADAVEIDLTNLDPDNTEWSEFVVDPKDSVAIVN